MANTITEVVPKLLAQGLMALRENAVMPMLVNRDYEDMAKQRGQSVDIPIPSAVSSVAVAPGPTPPANADSAPTSVSVPLDQWYEAPFYLTDREQMEVMDGVIPMQASEAVKSLANRADTYIFDQFYPGVYGFTGTAGTTPFGSTTADATQSRKNLNNQLAPMQDRRFVIDPDAEANALELRAFQDMSFSGSPMGIIEGDIGRKLGFTWWMDQNIREFTNTNGVPTGYLVNNASVSVGDVSTAIDTGSNVPVTGAIFTVAGDTQTYVVKAGSSGTLLNFAPAAKVAWADNAAITFKDDHTVNLAFHRDAFAFATRPLQDEAFPGAIVQSATDPVSGLSLRLEVTRQHKQTRWSFDMLYGGVLVRPEFATRLAG